MRAHAHVGDLKGRMHVFVCATPALSMFVANSVLCLCALHGDSVGNGETVRGGSCSASVSVAAFSLSLSLADVFAYGHAGAHMELESHHSHPPTTTWS